MENQRTEYIHKKNMNEQKTDKVNEMAIMSAALRHVGTLELKVPRTRDGHFSPTVFERYQRNEKALMASMLEMYVSGVSTRKVSKLWKNFVVNPSLSPSFLATEQQNLWLTSGRIVYYQKKLSLLNDRCTLYKSTRRKSSTLKKLSYSDWNNQRWRP